MVFRLKVFLRYIFCLLGLVCGVLALSPQAGRIVHHRQKKHSAGHQSKKSGHRKKPTTKKGPQKNRPSSKPKNPTQKHKSVKHRSVANVHKKKGVRVQSRQHTKPFSLLNKASFSQRAQAIGQKFKNRPCVVNSIKQLNNVPITLSFFHLIYPDLQMNGTQGKLVGFHHDYQHSLLNQGFYTMKVIKKLSGGAYKAKVYINGHHCATKSFFPSHWSDDTLASKIVEALNRPTGRPVWSSAHSTWNIVGKTSDGIKINIGLTSAGLITTAYPV